MKKWIIVPVMFLVVGAHAQLHKCVTSQGKVEYRDSACDDARQTRAIGGKVSDVQALSPGEMRRGQALIEAERRAQPAQALVIGTGRAKARPSEQDIKNMEAATTSITIGKKEREFLQAEVRRAKAAAAGDGSYTQKDLEELQEHQRAQNRIGAADRAAARLDAESVHLRAGGRSQTLDVVQQRQVEAERIAARRGAAPRIVTNCDRGGCWDNTGSRYTGTGATLFRSEGRTCTRSGTTLVCNLCISGHRDRPFRHRDR